jgi:hypothetical protein
MVDRFPEAFERFEEDVDVSKFKDYRELALAFSQWAGKRWRDSYKQNLALRKQGRRLGFKDAELPKYFRRRATSRYGKHRGFSDKQISIINESIQKGQSANKIQKQLRSQGLGIRRKELLKQIREIKTKSPKANPEKYIPRKYRK